MDYLMNYDFILIDILKYLDVKELMLISYTSKVFYKLI